jgi:superfamily II DNA or RNA helicase
LISPTASGKSLMIYGIVRYYVEKQQNILVVVPTTSLCYQMYKDFEDYGFDSEKNVSIIMGGKEKNPKIKKIVITFDDGEKRTFNMNDKVKTKRGFILAKDLMEDDLIL